MTSIEITREEIYNRIWATSAVSVAKDYGVSSQVLRKICAAMEVPMPPRGYWRRVATGGHPKVPQLPKLSEGGRSVATIYPSDVHALEQYRRARDLAESVSAHWTDMKVTVPATLEDALQITERTRAALNGARPSLHGLVSSQRAAGAFSIACAPTSIDRALRIADSLVRALEVRGYRLKPASQNAGCCAVVGGVSVPLCLTEASKRVAKEPARLPRHASATERRFAELLRPGFATRPSGRLSIRLEAHDAKGLRTVWSDTETKNLEDELCSVLKGIVAVAALTNEVREQRKRQDRERELRDAQRRKEDSERRQKQALLDAAKAAEARRGQDLERNAADWHKARQIRAYLRALTVRQHGTGGASAAPDPEWLRWAHEYADRLDPLTQTSPVDGR